MVGHPVARSWDALQPPMQHAVQLVWESFRGGSLGIGAVVTAPRGGIVAIGRDRLLEQHAGDDVLAGTSLAHAEMITIAAALIDGTTMIDLARSVDSVVDVAEALWPHLDQCVPEARLLAEPTAEV